MLAFLRSRWCWDRENFYQWAWNFHFGRKVHRMGTASWGHWLFCKSLLSSCWKTWPFSKLSISLPTDLWEDNSKYQSDLMLERHYLEFCEVLWIAFLDNRNHLSLHLALGEKRKCFMCPSTFLIIRPVQEISGEEHVKEGILRPRRETQYFRGHVETSWA